jgi:hypothetical protein
MYMPMIEEGFVMMFLGSFSIFMVANGLTLLKKEIDITMENHRTVPVKEEKQTQTEDDEEYPGIEYIEIPAKKTKYSSCLVM